MRRYFFARRFELGFILLPTKQKITNVFDMFEHIRDNCVVECRNASSNSPSKSQPMDLGMAISDTRYRQKAGWGRARNAPPVAPSAALF
jgi:hypothetical protein